MVLWEARNYQGRSIELGAGKHDLRNYNFDDVTSSAAEYRDSPAEACVRQLYRQVLGREVDPDGLSHHVNILRSGQQNCEQIRAGLASGQESRNNINNLYRQYLNRDADPGGIEHYVNILASGQMSLDQIREAIKNSQEAQQLNR